ncbi:hypothetical protein B0J14DRAFT_560363 [Halenospora varia]|nr:hypothetical protein B0J14DRAFT_560363 [Halenospora varia]
MLGIQRLSTPQPPSKLSTKERNDRKWESQKDNIRRVYMELDHTLKETMEVIQNVYHFKARYGPTLFNGARFTNAVSERKWKEKLKEWRFEKNIPSSAMGILVAKSEKRKREQGKETQFFYGDIEIKPQTISNFKKRKTTKVVDITSPIPGPQIIYTSPGFEDVSPASQQAAQTEPIHNMTTTDALPSPGHIPQGIPHESETIVETETETFLPEPSNGSGERNMLIGTISSSSMLWECPGRGLHTIDEESVIGLDDEILAPIVISELIANQMKGARIDHENHRTRSAAIKYLGAIILAIERKCFSTEILQEYLSEFLGFLEAGPGAYVIALQEIPERPIFQKLNDSDVCLLYYEVLTLLYKEFRPTSEVVTRICLLLANLETLYPETSHRADILYGVAIDGYAKMGEFDRMLDCEMSRADVLIDLNRTSDAYELLARSCGRYLRDYLDSWVDQTPSRTDYSLTSLSPVVPGVRPSIFRIKRILSEKVNQPGGIREHDTLYIMMIHEIAILGGILSVEASRGDSVWYLEALDPLWSEVFGKLALLSDTKFGSLKAFVHIQRSNYLCNGFNLFRHLNCLEDIRISHRYLSEGGYFRPELVNQFVRHFESLRSRAMNIPHLKTLNLMDGFYLAGISYVPYSTQSAAPGIQSFILDSTLERDELFDNTYLKRMYGVRYNDSGERGFVFAD